MRHTRHREIVRRLQTDDALSVGQLARACGVSTATIRRDLVDLELDGVLSRVHGGAMLVVEARTDVDAERSFEAIATKDVEAKRAVARCAADLVTDGDVVLLDIGTTAMMLALELRGRPLTVITSSLAVLDVLRGDTQVELILLGGSVRTTYHSLVGVLTADAAAQVQAQTAFLGASGIRADGSVIDNSTAEVPIKRAIALAANQTVVLADRHKFPGTGTLKVFGPRDVDILVTNTGADRATLAACRKAGTEVRLA